MAPEQLQAEGYGRMVDYWTFGCIVYEMLVGDQPFYHRNYSCMCEAISNVACLYPKASFQDLKIDDIDARHFVRRLLEKDVGQSDAAFQTTRETRMSRAERS